MVYPYSTLVYLVQRRFSTFENTSCYSLSKLVPQTSFHLNDEESDIQHKLKEGEARIRMMTGFTLIGIGGIFLSLVQQYMFRIWMTLKNFHLCIHETSMQKLLPDPLQAPYVQPFYTLVLEIKDVLMHPDVTGFKKRPGLDHFLRECAKYFEIVVYTTEQRITVFPLIDALDPSRFIMYRVVGDAINVTDSHHVKNLDNLNRDLRRVVVVDCDENSMKLHPSNFCLIPRWSGNNDDTALYDLVSFLSMLGTNEVADVREILHNYNQFSDHIALLRKNHHTLN
ncbi:mitochondrial import inner membrane translocase subunit TIM50-B [Drosophila tropicalis]|uniref:mitochondrial import inner membrane translocase subunit TIM50-B n=1 Tax=Drosophila tropicalis TaxID=46794 RepID=UPI0035AC1EDE